MQDIETYIAVHDQDIILACEAEGHFKETLSSYTYLFLGPRPIDKIPMHVKMILCRGYLPNFEHYPQFYDFTGFYVLYKHGLINARNVLLLQYDMKVLDLDIETKCAQMLDAQPGMIAFTAAWWPNFLLQVEGFEGAYTNGLREKGLSLRELGERNPWPCTQGMAWSTETLNRFMEWCEPLFDLMYGHVLAGHLMERMVTAYCSIHEPEQYLGGVISHDSQDCHGTGAMMAGRSAEFDLKSSTFGV